MPAPAAGPPLTPEQTAACAALLGALPEEIDPGVSRRPVDGGEGRVAAWGDPAVVLQCGVVPPDRPEEPAQINDLVWSVRDIGDGYRWTTEDLVPPVAVEIPGAYPNPGELVVPLAEPLLSTLPTAAPTP